MVGGAVGVRRRCSAALTMETSCGALLSELEVSILKPARFLPPSLSFSFLFFSLSGSKVGFSFLTLFFSVYFLRIFADFFEEMF